MSHPSWCKWRKRAREKPNTSVVVSTFSFDCNDDQGYSIQFLEKDLLKVLLLSLLSNFLKLISNYLFKSILIQKESKLFLPPLRICSLDCSLSGERAILILWEQKIWPKIREWHMVIYNMAEGSPGLISSVINDLKLTWWER